MAVVARTAPSSKLRAAPAAAYRRIEDLLADDRCVVLDGAIATELQDLRPGGAERGIDEGLWGTWALYRVPQAVVDVHMGYLAAGCDVISTNTWSILSMPDVGHRAAPGDQLPPHWMDAARVGIRLARQAIVESGKEGEAAVAFAISQDVTSERRRETIELLSRVFEEEQPDLVLMETLTLIRDPLTFETVELLLETGLPVWLSFRRCRHGVCGVYGEHWGPPEGDEFGRGARRFEQMGVGALLINCLPVDHVPGVIPWLRDFTDLPLGVYPNLGHLVGEEWHTDPSIGPAEYAELALEWRAEGAEIIGGCCGTAPAHLEAAAKALAGTKPGKRAPGALAVPQVAEPAHRGAPWVNELDRPYYPLPFPKLVIEGDVFVPTQGSYLCWRHLFDAGIGKGERCLEVGCGCGILSVQLALNGAESVYAIDIATDAVANTLSNAFRNGVADRVSGEAVDLYQWEPSNRYDVVIASLYQMPVDPYEEPTGHRPLDYWGRNLLDHFIRLLPRVLSESGRAFMMQLSIIGERRTSELLAQNGLEARVVDFTFFPFGPLFTRNRDQILRVEQLSDAYHIAIGDQDVMVAYLLEISRTGT